MYHFYKGASKTGIVKVVIECLLLNVTRRTEKLVKNTIRKAPMSCWRSEVRHPRKIEQRIMFLRSRYVHGRLPKDQFDFFSTGKLIKRKIYRLEEIYSCIQSNNIPRTALLGLRDPEKDLPQCSGMLRFYHLYHSIKISL